MQQDSSAYAHDVGGPIWAHPKDGPMQMPPASAHSGNVSDGDEHETLHVPLRQHGATSAGQLHP